MAKTWQNVTPPAMTPWSKVSQIEAGHFDAETAYASVDRHRIADNKPYIYRTHDGGKTWKNIVAGIPEGAFVNSVKEDPKAKGLLYAATELRVYVSFNDGAQWQPLQNNMPVTSIRDIVVHGDDLDIATHGRGFWVMDQMSALREIAAKGAQIASASAYLFTPGETFAIRAGGMNGTPLPHEEPQQLNPPAGVLAYYWLKSAASQPLKIELLDGYGGGAVRASRAIRRCGPSIPRRSTFRRSGSSPRSRLRPRPGCIASRSARTAGRGGGFGDAARRLRLRRMRVRALMPRTCAGGWARRTRRWSRRTRGGGLAPGQYTVRLTVDGQTYTQPVALKPDPRGVPEGAN